MPPLAMQAAWLSACLVKAVGRLQSGSQTQTQRGEVTFEKQTEARNTGLPTIPGVAWCLPGICQKMQPMLECLTGLQAIQFTMSCA
jgi:hypothetical protein